MTFNYTILFTFPTCFSLPFDHPQAVVQQEYKKYTSDNTENVFPLMRLM
jgi:hypothetical protein